LKNFREALANFTRAVDLEPSEQALNGKGVTYVSMKEYDEAEESFRQALAIDPNSFQTRFNLGIVCLIREKRDCALRQYNFLKMFNPPLADRLFEKIVAGRVLDLGARHEPKNSPWQ
jgi:tetratricopeptide (TPR) repeat protein